MFICLWILLPRSAVHWL